LTIATFGCGGGEPAQIAGIAGQDRVTAPGVWSAKIPCVSREIPDLQAGR
jgi:hypothetical protein